MFRRPCTRFGVHGRFFLNIGFLRKFVITYSGCQKNVTVSKRFFLQTLMPQFRNSEHFNGKRYKSYAFNGSILEILILGTTLIALELNWVFQTGCFARESKVQPRCFSTIGALRSPVFFRLSRKNPSHPLCGWSLTRYYEIITIQLPIGGIEYAFCQNY
jgi:hypothetical protein